MDAQIAEPKCQWLITADVEEQWPITELQVGNISGPRSSCMASIMNMATRVLATKIIARHCWKRDPVREVDRRTQNSFWSAEDKAGRTAKYGIRCHGPTNVAMK